MPGMRALTKQEIQKIKQTLTNPRDYCLFVLGYRTGFRITELLSITIKDILNKDYLKVSRKNMKNQIVSREVILHKEAKNAIALYLNTMDSTQLNSYLFKSKRGGAISRIQAHRILKGCTNKLQLQGSISTHSMRKSYAFDMYRKLGKDLVATKKALGHSSIMSTIKYLDPDQETINKALLED